MNRMLASALISGIILSTPLASSAAPLPAGTTLTIEPAICSGGALLAGSAFAVSGFTPAQACLLPGSTGALLEPGTQGGIVIGSNQLGGGQDTGLSSSNTTPGQIDAAWLFSGNYGTHFIPAGAYNAFDSASCVGSGCTGLTRLASWWVAWNSSVIPFGGGNVDAWTVSGTNYSLDYRHTPPCLTEICPFYQTVYALHLEGEIVVPATPIATHSPLWTLTPTSTPRPTFTPTPAPAPDFALSIIPSNQSVAAGQIASYIVGVSSIGGFSGAVTLSKDLASTCTETLSFVPNPVNLITIVEVSTMTVPASQAHPACLIVVQGTSGGISHTALTLLTVVTPTPTFTPTSTPTPTPLSPCEQAWPPASVTTLGKGGSPAVNGIVNHTIVGNIVDPLSYNDTATRIALCAGTTAKVFISDTSGAPTTMPLTRGIVCSSPNECTVSAISGKVQYAVVSADGSDKDRIALVAQ